MCICKNNINMISISNHDQGLVSRCRAALPPAKHVVNNILYYLILYYTILYYTILYYTILYYTILYYTILYNPILYYRIIGPQ